MNLPILSLVTFVPLFGALAILAMPKAQSARWIALGTTIVVFALSLVVWAGFDNANPGFQMVEKANWLGGGISYHMGVDGISMLFVILATFVALRRRIGLSAPVWMGRIAKTGPFYTSGG